MNNEEQQFLNDLDKRLWDAADRLRSNVNPSDYMHVVLGLVFLKYVSDAFKERRAELQTAFKNPADDYDLGDDAGELIEQELEARDYYTEKNVFWVPAIARWDFLQANAKVAVDTVLEVRNGKTWQYKFKGIGRLLDDALEGYADEPGFCKATTLDDIRKSDHVLTPGRYVGAAAQEEDGEPFEDKMARLTAVLGEQFKESARLEAEIRKNLAGLGYAV